MCFVYIWSSRANDVVLRVPEVVQAPYATVLGAFAGTSASAPVLGVVLGGIVIDKIGGNEPPRTVDTFW
jgi:hypothetical protein